ncbi:MAG TPA: hypothetical protein VGJ94_07225 [Syntrophorhabdaceae bacterium]|jgi:hypothetical protein
MPLYRVTDSHIHHDGVLYGPGDTIELAEEQAAGLSVGLLPEGQQGSPGKNGRVGEGKGRK